ncbi:MAG: polysaccharide biosynthesis tyrosine autokinase [Anaerolineales bacterium]|nr:polysaccharide biosynthesis tyrosine autokinase [Anaerolineales bacterium]
MNLFQFFQILKRRYLVIVITILIALLLAFAGKALFFNSVVATATLRFTLPENSNTELSERTMNTFIQIAGSKPIIDEFRDQAGIDQGEELSVEVISIPNSELVEITVRDSDPQRAQRLANTFAQVIIEAEPISDMQLSIIEPASLPDSPQLLQQILFYSITGILGLVVGVGLAYLLERYETSLRSSNVVERATGLKVIGEIPSHRGKTATKFILDTYPFYDTFLRLRTNILSREDLPKKAVIAFTSAVPEDGKSTIAANVGRSFGLAGLKTIIIDTDMLHPTIDNFYDLKNNTGLSNLLSGENDLNEVINKTDYLNVDVITSGPPKIQSADLLGSKKMKKLLLKLREEYDLIILDTPAILSVADGLMIVPQADGVVMVSNFASTTETDLKSCVQQLRDAQANLIGAVVNQTRNPNTQKYYAYYQKEIHQPAQVLGKIDRSAKEEVWSSSLKEDRQALEPLALDEIKEEGISIPRPEREDVQINKIPEPQKGLDYQQPAMPSGEKRVRTSSADIETITRINERIWGISDAKRLARTPRTPRTPRAQSAPRIPIRSNRLEQLLASFYIVTIQLPADMSNYIGSIVAGRVIANKRWQNLAKTFVDDNLI